MISLVIPSRNNKKYVQFAYNSIRKHLQKNVEVILLDDASTDGTWEWMQDVTKTDSKTKIYRNERPERVGHTVLYDVGADMASNEYFGIFHADMIATPNYLNNLIKYCKPERVLSATRIEPPLHPPGPEKYVMDFGMEPEQFKEKEFLDFVNEKERQNANKTTNGIFAPWIISGADFKAIGGHDKRVFAPMELEDSDLFNRFLLKGYELIQSRDAFVYHMTCRGSRFKDGVKIIQEIPLGNGQIWKRSKDSDEYTKLRQNKFREWWRKWHMDVLHDENMLPIVCPRYDVGFVVKNCTLDLLYLLEPWCDTLYCEDKNLIMTYLIGEQQQTKFDLTKRVKHISFEPNNDIVVEFDARQFTNAQANILRQIPLMIADSGDLGIMEYDIFRFEIKALNRFEKSLIHADNPWYVNQLL